MTELHIAAVNGNTESVRQLLLRAGTEVDCRGRYGETPLMLAAESGNLAVVKLLLEAGAAVNCKDEGGWSATALHGAASSSFSSSENSAAIIELLLKAGAEVDARDNQGKTALEKATEYGRGEVVRSLKKAIDEKKVEEDLAQQLQRQQLNDTGEDGLLSVLQADLNEKDACLRAMKAEKERMEEKLEKLTCKLCMDAEVTTAFTPCGHLFCCACASNGALVECPICRGHIASKIKIYLI